MQENSLLNIKRGIIMNKLNPIKESSTKKEVLDSLKNTKPAGEHKKEVNSYLTGDNGDIVSMMEAEWPEMTKEFKRLQRGLQSLKGYRDNSTNCFSESNMIMVLVIFLWVLCYKQKKKYNYHLQVFGFV